MTIDNAKGGGSEEDTHKASAQRKGRWEGTTSKGTRRGAEKWAGKLARMKLYTHNDPVALYRADRAAWQQMRLQEANSDVVVYQEIRLQGTDNVVRTQMYNEEGQEYQR